MANISDEDFEAMMVRYERTHTMPLQDPPKTVAATIVKLPTFWIEDPELWFAQVECVFNNRQPKITQEATKYNYVCESQKSVTKQAELLEMVSNPTMGDNIPSDILLLIRNLSGSSYKDVERAIFLSHLPPAVRTVLASLKAETNDQLADEANAIFSEHKVGARGRARTCLLYTSPSPRD